MAHSGSTIRSIPLRHQLVAFIIFFLKLQLNNWMMSFFVIIFPFIFFCLLGILKALLYWLTEAAPLRIDILELVMSLFATRISQSLTSNTTLPYIMDNQLVESVGSFSWEHTLSADTTSLALKGLKMSYEPCPLPVFSYNLSGVIATALKLIPNAPQGKVDTAIITQCKSGANVTHSVLVQGVDFPGVSIPHFALTLTATKYYLKPYEEFYLDPSTYLLRENQLDQSLMGPLYMHSLDACNFSVYIRDCPIVEKDQAFVASPVTISDDALFKSLVDISYRSWYTLHYGLDKTAGTVDSPPQLTSSVIRPYFKFVDYVLIPDVRYINDTLMEMGSYLVILFVGHMTLPLIAVLIATQKSTGFLSLLFSSGLHPAVYYLTIFIFYYVISLCMSLVNVFATLVFNMDAIFRLGWLMLIITFIYPIFSIPLAIVFANVFKSTFSASIMSWFTVMFIPQMISIISKVVPFDHNPLDWFIPIASLACICSKLLVGTPALTRIIVFCGVQCLILGPLILFLQIYLTTRGMKKRKGLLKKQKSKGAQELDGTTDEIPFESEANEDPDDETVAVRLTNVNKDFKTKAGVVHAVQNLSFVVHTGEIFSLLGHNGCGKSTTVNMIAGAIPSTSGSITLNGYLCFAPQYDVLPNDIRVDQALEMFGRMRGLTKIECLEESMTLLKLLNLQQLRRKFIKQCSGGSQRRISFACACIGTKPRDVILCDEVTTGLSRTDAQGVWAVLLSMQKKNISVILISHDLDEAEMLSSRVLFMSGGRAIRSGNPTELTMSPEFQVNKLLAPNPIQELEDFLEEHPDAGSKGYLMSGVVYSVRVSAFPLERLMTLAQHHEDCFVDNVGLEDVFFAIEESLKHENAREL
ncbi:ABC transporter, ATP-binding protein [Giardia muris]|uniref:ABC transporter, ATP-binding protein n=1 Tax=Giardia muris TaxID=5742 RepID=A0A4Z1T1J8_GIAMU|nr:ABC transporter, ATP-binding protein [Giardia muris]|eukprot:TNJ27793.1 ABC transporter, ATP-binding protein [Giardia muris]